MADERNRWLDRAAAERVLRGAPAVPGGDRSAREAEARLRAALDMLTGPQPCAGAELPGEAAAVAAFRAARAGAEAPAPSGTSVLSAVPAVPGTSAEADGDTSPLVEIGRILPLAAPASTARRSRPVRFGLVAALAGVAVGSLAVAAGAGLLDRSTHDSAGPVPAVSLSADENPTPPGDTGGPTPGPQLRPTPFRGADGVQPTPGGGATPGGLDSGALEGFGTGTGPASGGGTDRDGGDGKVTKDDKETLAGGTTSLKDADKQTRLKAVDLCEAYRSGQMTSDRRDKLSKLAKGLTRIPRFCEELLDGPARSTTPIVPRGSEIGGDVLKAPTPTPVNPGASSPARLPSR
ncbi:hypothetical protein ADK52_24850 [Streptomyces sp. WM6372]|uniref:hypothetical protein n=1 Tax=Streptomyces sp. WM6372 TaxID=1415555 RepID=UPI0006AFA9BA|nr:hypothetical protein [Streptomyces sp. WM6372]KOU21163.1 hypothetical protein ADK52_24850 [Streptomyces sp. WM6372]